MKIMHYRIQHKISSIVVCRQLVFSTVQMSYLFPKSMCRFLRQHRRKFIFTGVFVGGMYGIIKAAEYKIKDHIVKEQQKISDEMKYQKHFDQVQQHCLSITEAMLEDILEKVKQVANTEIITRKLKSGSGDKISLWNDLKVTVFCRIVTGIYSVTLAFLVLHVQINQVAGLMFNTCERNADVVDSCQQNFISISHDYLMHQGIYDLASHVLKVTRGLVETMPLQGMYNFKDLEKTLQSISASLFHRSSDSEGSRPKLLQFAFPEKLTSEEWTSISLTRLDDIEVWSGKTIDIMDSPDFKHVCLDCVNKGITSVATDICCSVSENESLSLSSHITEVQETSLPLAKLLPILNAQLYSVCSVKFLQQITKLPILNQFSKNVYDSFLCH